jgi:hypothetical protein
MIFLSGIPRSCSTLLCSLLGQRPDTVVSTTSALGTLVMKANLEWENSVTCRKKGDGREVFKAMMDAYHPDQSAKYFFDKSRDWSDPYAIAAAKTVQDDVRIIATVRPFAECAASFVKLCCPDDLPRFLSDSVPMDHLFRTYQTLKLGYEAFPDNIHFVRHADLVTNPQATLDGVSDFIGAEHFEHWLTDLDQVEEDDSAWDEVWGGDKTLHQLKADVDSNTEFDTSMIPENMKLDSFWDAIL